MEYFKHVVAKPKIYNTGAAFDFSGFGSGSLWIALVTFLYVDFLDTTGTLFSMCNFVNIFIPGTGTISNFSITIFCQSVLSAHPS